MRQRIAWITGASGDIGAAICKQLAKENIHIAAGYYQNQSAAEQVVASCRQEGVKAYSIPIDVRDEHSVREGYDWIRYQLGHPTILVHAAGNLQVGLVQDFTEDDYRQIMEVHVGGAFRMVRQAVPHLVGEKWGRILFLSSVWGEEGGAGEVLYSAAKGALNSMSKALAKELAPSGVTVNAIAPGVIASSMMDQQLSSHEQESLIESIPIGRMGTPDEVASLARYLVSDEAAYMTGQVIGMNGGFS